MAIPFENEVEELLAAVRADGEQRMWLRELMLRAAALPPSQQRTVNLDVQSLRGTTPAPAPRRHERASGQGERYRHIEVIGEGGMSDVSRVHDLQLDRSVARKTVRKELAHRDDIVDRFVQEAQTTAQLQHPAIVPVHELGVDRDGRHWFTMKEVQGETLSVKIRTLHAVSRRGRWGSTRDGTTLRRVVQVFHEVCLAMAYAHDRGVVHRDLKPDNVMVGRYGEVFVMDWGLAKILDPDADEPLQVTPRLATETGRVTGTPAYMSPEQAWGSDQLTTRTDVYSLGAVLYEILAGHPPYQGEPREIVRLVRNGVPVNPPGALGAMTGFAETRDYPREGEGSPAELALREAPPAPAELVELCMQALAFDPADRPADAKALAARVSAWLDGSERRQRAMERVREARLLADHAEDLRHRARELAAHAEASLERLPTWAPVDDKRPHWDALDESQRLLAEVDLLELDQEGLLRGALAESPGMVEAHAALARFHHVAHRRAEAAGDQRRAAMAEVRLRAHTHALPADQRLRETLEAYLDGWGSLGLEVATEGATARLARLITVDRRLERADERSVALPLERMTLPQGDYLIEVEAPGHHPVVLPVVITRQGHWPPAPWSASAPVALLPEGELGPDDVHVPAGPYDDDGDLKWCDAFVMRRQPVTLRDYLAFLDALAAQGREEEALRHMPRDPYGGVSGVAYCGDQTFRLLPDPEGLLWDADWPAIMVDLAGAQAFAAYEAERTGQAWRLPHEREWLRAARGPFGLRFPWGDHAEPTWLRSLHSAADGPSPARVHDVPGDTSLHGIRHLAGNVMEWCLDEAHPSGRGPAAAGDGGVAHQVLRGGAWSRRPELCDSRHRNILRADARMPDVGFRLVRSVPSPGSHHG